MGIQTTAVLSVWLTVFGMAAVDRAEPIKVTVPVSGLIAIWSIPGKEGSRVRVEVGGVAIEADRLVLNARNSDWSCELSAVGPDILAKSKDITIQGRSLQFFGARPAAR